MRTVAATARIAAPPQRVWDLYADVEGSVSWVPFAEEILFVSGPPGLGQVYRERTRLGGIADVAEWTVVEWDPPRRQVQRSTAKRMDSRLVIEVGPDGDGARVVQRAILESMLPGPLGRLHEAVFSRVARKGVREAVAAAKRHLEAPSASEAASAAPDPMSRRGASRLAHAFFPRFYRLLRLAEPLMALGWRRFGLGNIVRVIVPGRTSGQPRPVFLGVLRVGRRRYLGHPDVATGWTRNVEAAGTLELEFPDGRREACRAVLLASGRERRAAIRATFRQHPFPGGVFYWLARRHVLAVGRFYRLVPIDGD